MMKKLSNWKKAGAAAAISLPLLLGTFIIQNVSGLESKIPSIGTSTAQANIINPKGYQVPDLTGRTPKITDYEQDKGLTYKVEIFLNVGNQNVIRLSRKGKVFGYIIDEGKNGRADYSIIDSDGDGKFESKYYRAENYGIPEWVI